MLKNEKLSEFPHVSHEHMKTLQKCFSVCSSCAKMCIEERRPETAILCSECADICALTIKWHSADSNFTKKISQLCAEICTKCSEACGKHESPHCQQCSEVCYECSAACKNDNH